MKTVIYLMRHSEPMGEKNNIANNDNLQIQNEKNPLSVIGEQMAKKLSLKEEMKNIDIVISSNYVRAISTAKYIAYENDTSVNIIENFGERKFGVDSWDEKPKNFDIKQIDNENFKMQNGKSRKETAERMYNALLEVLDKYEGKTIAIINYGIPAKIKADNRSTFSANNVKNKDKK